MLMLTKEQKNIIATKVINDILAMDLPRLHGLQYFDETNILQDRIEVETWENMQSINILAFFTELNLAGLIFTNKQNDVYSTTHNHPKKDNILVDIYTFKFI